MNWQETRKHFPHQWVLVEVLKAHSQDEQRMLDELVVIRSFEDSRPAWQEYTKLHHRSPHSEFYVLHTDREQLEIQQRHWLGIRCIK